MALTFPGEYSIVEGNYLQGRTKRYSEYILDPYLFSDLNKRQLTLSNNDEIEIDLFIVFPSTILYSPGNVNAMNL
jgi:hypothetical protein